MVRTKSTRGLIMVLAVVVLGSTSAQAASPPPLKLAPSPLNTGQVVINELSASRHLTVTNTLSRPVTVGGLQLASITGHNIHQVQVRANGSCASGQLAPGASCGLDLTLQVNATDVRSPVGQFSVQLLLTSTDSMGASLPGSPITLIGTAVGPFRFTSPFDVGTVVVNQPGSGRTLTITNRLTRSITLTGLTFITTTGQNIRRVTVSTHNDGCAGRSLGPGASCRMNLVVQVNAKQVGTPVGPFSIRVLAESTDASATKLPPTPLTLTGNAVGALALSPSPLDVGKALVGQHSASRRLTLTNLERRSVKFDRFRFVATSGRNISGVSLYVSNSTCTHALAPGASCHLDLAVQVRPVHPSGAVGAFTVRLLAASTGPDGEQPPSPFSLTGDAVAEPSTPR